VTGNTVYPMSAGDGWTRISTIKMLSHPSGQGKDPPRHEGWVPHRRVSVPTSK